MIMGTAAVLYTPHLIVLSWTCMQPVAYQFRDVCNVHSSVTYVNSV